MAKPTRKVESINPIKNHVSAHAGDLSAGAKPDERWMLELREDIGFTSETLEHLRGGLADDFDGDAVALGEITPAIHRPHAAGRHLDLEMEAARQNLVAE